MIKYLILLLLFGCSTHKKYNFPNKDVCFLLFNLKTGTFEEIIGQKRCEERFPAASTFKIPLAVMAFDQGLLKDKDQASIKWMNKSLVSFSQELTPKIGKERIESYLQSFEYGNADMSSGLTTAWLTPAAHKNSLKISGFEQIHFLKNLWRGELKASEAAQLKTIDLLTTETSANGQRLLGKTGSATVGADFDLRLGWWVGFLETKQDQYIVVVNFNDVKKAPERIFIGAEARDIAKQILAEKKL